MCFAWFLSPKEVVLSYGKKSVPFFTLFTYTATRRSENEQRVDTSPLPATFAVRRRAARRLRVRLSGPWRLRNEGGLASGGG